MYINKTHTNMHNSDNLIFIIGSYLVTIWTFIHTNLHLDASIWVTILLFMVAVGKSVVSGAITWLTAKFLNKFWKKNFGKKIKDEDDE